MRPVLPLKLHACATFSVWRLTAVFLKTHEKWPHIRSPYANSFHGTRGNLEKIEALSSTEGLAECGRYRKEGWAQRIGVGHQNPLQR